MVVRNVGLSSGLRRGQEPRPADMVERVARAIFAVDYTEDGAFSEESLRAHLENCPQAWKISRASARAAIAAMAYEDGADEDMFVRVSTTEYVEPVSLICAWDALIEEALK